MHLCKRNALVISLLALLHAPVAQAADVALGPDALLYLSTDAGKIVRILPK